MDNCLPARVLRGGVLSTLLHSHTPTLLKTSHFSLITWESFCTPKNLSLITSHFSLGKASTLLKTYHFSLITWESPSPKTQLLLKICVIPRRCLSLFSYPPTTKPMKRMLLLFSALLGTLTTLTAKKVELTIDGTVSPGQTTLYLIINEDIEHARLLPVQQPPA